VNFYLNVYFSGLKTVVYWNVFSLTFRLRLWPASSEHLAPRLLLGVYWTLSVYIIVHSWCDVITCVVVTSWFVVEPGPLKMPATDAGEMSGRSISRPRFLSLKSKHSNISANRESLNSELFIITNTQTTQCKINFLEHYRLKY
jgi:hypothetical protein